MEEIKCLIIYMNNIIFDIQENNIIFNIEYNNINTIFIVEIQNIKTKLRFTLSTSDEKSSILIIDQNNIENGIKTLSNIPHFNNNNNNKIILSNIPRICNDIIKKLNEIEIKIKGKNMTHNKPLIIMFINNILIAYNKKYVPQIRPIMPPSNKQISYNLQFKSKINTTLRFQANNADPNMNPTLNGFPFKGKNISENNILIYPNGLKNNELVLVQDFNNPNIIGYLPKELLATLDYYNGYTRYTMTEKPIKLNVDTYQDGSIITAKNILVYPAGQRIPIIDPKTNTTSDYVIVQKIDDANVFGYIKYEDLILLNQNNKYKMKYLKYKMKYLKLKQEIRI